MDTTIRVQDWRHRAFYVFFALASSLLLLYYLSDTIIHFTTPQQFPINSLERFPLTFLIFPAELFSFFFGLYFTYALLTDAHRQQPPRPLSRKDQLKVAILLPVYHEPKDIVERTIKACKAIRWPGGTQIYLLDDSKNEADQRNMQALATDYACKYIQREDRKGYKAGNINNAVKHHVKERFFVIFDADQAPTPGFLKETMDHFSDPTVAFVQTPQHFIGEKTPLERAAKLGTNIFYQALCVSKARDGAMAFCGTNAVVRTDTFKRVHGFSYYTATEDLDLGIRMNDEGYRGVYVPKILAHGYAPADFIAYSSQQYRWANGNLAVLREHWYKILFGKHTLRYQMHTFFTLGWWLIGLVTLSYILVPLLSFFLGSTHHTWLPTWILGWIYLHVLLGVSIIYVSLHNRTGEKVTLGDAFLQYSLITNSLFIYARAAVSALFKRYVGFVRTSKVRAASSWWHIKWNLLLGAVCFGFSMFALYHAATAADFLGVRTFLPLSLWLLFYSMILASSIIFVGGVDA